MKFKIRCSAIGTLMAGQIGLTEKQFTRMNELLKRKADSQTNKARDLTPFMYKELSQLIETHENPKLPQGAKSYVEQWVKERLYERESFKGNKYTDKGLIVEDESIDFIAKQLGYPMLLKNTKHYEGEFITGTPDIVLPSRCIDAKNSWDFSTFPIFETEIPEKSYWWQGQGYMHLTETKVYVLAYTLMDTPQHLVESEYRSHCFRTGTDVNDKEQFEEFQADYQYSELADYKRFKAFSFEYSSQAIQEVESRVKLAQNYVDELLGLIGESNG